MVKLDHIKHVIELSEPVALQLMQAQSLSPRMAQPFRVNSSTLASALQ